MKYLALILIFIAFNTYAETTDQFINRSCLKHAVSLVDELNSKVFADMNKEQSNKILRITTENCKEHFYNKKNMEAVAATNNEQADKKVVEEKESDDWFTENIISGEVPNKAGNKRLKRLQHK